MTEVARVLGAAIGRPVSYRFVDQRDDAMRRAFVERFGGTPEKWLDEMQTLDAINDRRVCFSEDRITLPTTLERFAQDDFRPRYLEAIQSGRAAPETFLSWTAGPEVGDR